MVLSALRDSNAGSRPDSPSLAELWSGGWPMTPREFEQLVDVFQERLIRYAFCRLWNLQDAEDVIQRVLVRAYAEREKLKKVEHVGPYLYRMSANACTDLLRQRGRRKEISWDDLENRNELAAPTDASQPAGIGEQERRIERWLQRLPRRQSEVIRYRIFDDLSFAEIAEVTGCSESTVKSRFRYGLDKLRTRMLREREMNR